jgi:hypothetical protein
MHETPASAGWRPSTFPAWSRAGARPAQTVRTERGPSIPHRLRAASRAADVGSHGYRLSLQTGRQGSEVAHGDAKCVGCRENRSGCRISAWGRWRAGHRHGGRSAGETSDTTDAPRGGLHGHTSDVADVPRRCRYPDRRYPDTCTRPHRHHQPRRPARCRGRRHGFRRSHGPSEQKVNEQWLTFRCHESQRLDRLRPAHGLRCQECRRNPRAAETLSARAAPSLVRHAGPPAGEPVHAMRAGAGRASRRSSETEGTESRGNPGVYEPAAPQTNLVLRECVMEVGRRILDFLGLRLTSAEAQPLSAPAVRPWTR